jgi:hypothetical protein
MGEGISTSKGASTRMNAKNIISTLKKRGIRCETGLSLEEIKQIELKYKISFPPDYLELLQTVLPVGDQFPNWRDFSESNSSLIRSRLNWPLEGMLFDIEHNVFWHESWGPKPDELEKAKEICIRAYEKVPPLIPVCSHRYIPSFPYEYGNPVFSVYQTDIIYYGENLEEYFKVEFNMKPHMEIDYSGIKHIEFWSDIVS